MEERKKTKEMDMLNGGLAGKLILFAVPLAFSSILQQLFNSADVAVVGRFAGSQALAAVGSCVQTGGISGADDDPRPAALQQLCAAHERFSSQH